MYDHPLLEYPRDHHEWTTRSSEFRYDPAFPDYISRIILPPAMELLTRMLTQGLSILQEFLRK